MKIEKVRVGSVITFGKPPNKVTATVYEVVGKNWLKAKEPKPKRGSGDWFLTRDEIITARNPR